MSKTNCARRILEIVDRARNHHEKDHTYIAWGAGFELDMRQNDATPVVRRLVLLLDLSQILERKMRDKGDLVINHGLPVLHQLRSMIQTSMCQVTSPWEAVRKHLREPEFRQLGMIGGFLELDEYQIDRQELDDLRALTDAFEASLLSSQVSPDLRKLLMDSIEIIRRALFEAEVIGPEAWRVGYRHGWLVVTAQEDLEKSMRAVPGEEGENLRKTFAQLWRGGSDLASRIDAVWELAGKLKALPAQIIGFLESQQ